MSITVRSLVMLLFCTVVAQQLTRAGGPVDVTGGTPVVWETGKPIVFAVDRGGLGTLEEAAAFDLARAAFAQWSAVDTAALRFDLTRVADDILTSVDYAPFEEEPQRGSTLVFDESGAIVEALYGEQSSNSLLGWTMPFTAEGHIVRAVALLNGKAQSSESSIRATLVHEIGHVLGMDHAQIHPQFAKNRDVDDDEFLPTMFPTDSDDEERLGTLNPDDIAWVSALYPGPHFETEYGAIAGKLLREGLGPSLGVNLVASRTNEDGTLDRTHVFSCVSDYLTEQNGAFRIPLPPGVYRLHAEPILPQFVAESSVGPYAQTLRSASFSNPAKFTVLEKTVEVRVGAATQVGELTIR